MKQTANSFFIGDTPKGSVSALPRAGGRGLSASILHRIAAANESLEHATARLIRLADLAYGARDFEALRELSEALAALPFAAAQRAATYFRAVTLKRAGHLDSAASLLATVNAPRALLTLGTVEECRGNYAEAARLHVEAMRAGRNLDPFTVAGAAIQLATIRGIEGDHAGSLYAFQNIGPLVWAVARHHPSLWPILQNSIAVELAELGRSAEARAAIAVALASPIAQAYPEFEATAAEIRQAQPQRIAVVVVEPQQDDEPTAPAPSLVIDTSEPPRLHRFIIQPYARAQSESITARPAVTVRSASRQ
jgi:tetratricopeptide (TPR) repeat protein